MRSVNVRLDELQRTIIPIGFVGENIYTRVLIDCKEIFDEHPNVIPALSINPPQGEPYPVIITRDGNNVIWAVRDSDLGYPGNGEIQLTFMLDEMIAKSYVGRICVFPSIIPTGDPPDPMEDWLTRAETMLEEMPQEVSRIIGTELGEVTAVAFTLAPGSEATANYDAETKVLTFGIPKGDTGEQGERGLPGMESVLVGTQISGNNYQLGIERV